MQHPVPKFSRNRQKAHLHTNTFHLSLKPSLFNLSFKSSNPYKKAMTDGHPNSIDPKLWGWPKNRIVCHTDNCDLLMKRVADEPFDTKISLFNFHYII